MKKIKLLSVIALFVISITSCRKENNYAPQQNTITADSPRIYTGFPESFETSGKTTYATADVNLSTGSWNFNDALLGTLSNDHKNGTKAVRIENTGKLTMNFDVTSGASQVTLVYAIYGSDAGSTFGLWYSLNSGSTWMQAGNNINATSSTLNTATFNLSATGNVRFQLRKLSGGRLNIDDFSINDNSTPPPPDNDNITMGNPSAATTDINFPNNYLLIKTQYDLSYNNSKGECGWVSWHLGSSDLGSTPRCDCFTLDAQLPSSFYRAGSTSYSGSGFDRGHQCPSADRTDNATNNAATFLMSNMMPQSPHLNQITWAALEDYERTLVNQGNELYVISGGYGTGGTGSNGGTTNSINNGNINVPSHYWKVIVVLPNGNNDASRVTSSTRVITVDMPNNQTVNSHPWGYYRVSVDAVESLTGYDFLSNISTTLQSVIEASVDNGPTQ
jgi:endonuclease G